jgi:hypothetical protein
MRLRRARNAPRRRPTSAVRETPLGAGAIDLGLDQLPAESLLGLFDPPPDAAAGPERLHVAPKPTGRAAALGCELFGGIACLLRVAGPSRP